MLITPKLDRMFRSARDALDVLDCLKGQGVSLHMIDLGGDVTGNGISKLVFTVLSAVAEAERDRTRERIGCSPSAHRRAEVVGSARVCPEDANAISGKPWNGLHNPVTPAYKLEPVAALRHNESHQER